MGEFRQPGRRPTRLRYELRVTYDWLDLVTEAARSVGQSVADYIREAVAAQLTRDGFADRRTRRAP
jgi:uncharacterized protein (DUF1778 family)